MSRVLLSLMCVSFCLGLIPTFPLSRFHQPNPKPQPGGSVHKCAPSVFYHNQPVDHFNFQNNATFRQRYLVCAQYYEDGGPMFFYTGNEGDILTFYDNTGFMLDIAPQFNAMIVFAEHRFSVFAFRTQFILFRYYGTSLPFGADSFSRQNIGFLSVEQALEDFVALIRYIKGFNNTPNQSVVAFGGSYGGLLTAWMRLHYPTVIVGGIAGSAPVRQYLGVVDPEAMWNQTSNDYAMAVPGCADAIRQSFEDILTLGKTPQGLAELSNYFSLCTPLESYQDVETLVSWANLAYSYAALEDYPYPNSFLQPVPAWPVTAMCKQIIDPSDPNFLYSIANALGVFYNYTGQQPACFNISQEADADNGITGWYYQVCTQVIVVYGNDGVHDMFLPPTPFNATQYTADCQATWGVTPDFNWWPTFQGGPNLEGLTNVFFSNGQLDPWGIGGILTNLSDSVLTFMIEGGAHHLDLRAANPADPPAVVECRQMEVHAIQTWLAEAEAERKRQNY